MKKFFSTLVLAVAAYALVFAPVNASAAYWLLTEPNSSYANQSTPLRNIDLNFKIFTGSSDRLFYTYYICPTVSSDAGDVEVLVNNCRSFYIDGFNSYSSYQATIDTGVQLLYPGPNTIGCMVLSSKDNLSDYQWCGDFGDTIRVNYTGNSLPVYRFWSNKNQRHFYTMSAPEKTSIMRNYPRQTWDYEAIAFTTARYNGGCSDGSPVYRFWSNVYQSHFYTISEEERYLIPNKWPGVWNYEGIAYCSGAYPTGNLTKAVYRFWSESNRSHFYTTSLEERNQVMQKWPHIWQYEGVAYYVN